MWFEKKTRPEAEPPKTRPAERSPAPLEEKEEIKEIEEKVEIVEIEEVEEREEKIEETRMIMSEPTLKSTVSSGAGGSQTVLGRTVVVQGQLSSGEDLLIEGQFDGTINLDDHCLTVGPEGHVKAEIRARQVVILGNVNGNIAAGEKIEIRRTGHVLGDLVAATVAIEEGAYLKGSIDISRDRTSDDSSDEVVTSTFRAAS